MQRFSLLAVGTVHPTAADHQARLASPGGPTNTSNRQASSKGLLQAPRGGRQSLQHGRARAPPDRICVHAGHGWQSPESYRDGGFLARPTVAATPAAHGSPWPPKCTCLFCCAFTRLVKVLCEPTSASQPKASCSSWPSVMVSWPRLWAQDAARSPANRHRRRS
jgi:glyoxylase-like metal-dependent hydrolase (beta-lactamase superfamily II)